MKNSHSQPHLHLRYYSLPSAWAQQPTLKTKLPKLTLRKMSRSPPKWPSLLLSNKIFRTAGFITHEFKQTIKHPTNQYRLLVTHDGGRVFVAAENNDNDQEVLSIVVKYFLLKTCYDIPLRVTSNNGLDPLVEAMTWLMLAFISILCCPALKP